MITTAGRVYEQRGIVYVKTSRPAADNLADDVTVVWRDRRRISDEQRRKAWALVGEIAAYAGYMVRERETVNQHLKQRFLMQQAEEYQRQMFSLSDCTMTQAREYITYLIDFCLAEDVPTRVPLVELADDLEQMTYSALIHKKCVCCQKRAELHHVDAIGMGFNRETKPQLGALVLPLCRVHHGEWHDLGIVEFDKKYHIIPVKMDHRIASLYKLSQKAQRPMEVSA